VAAAGGQFQTEDQYVRMWTLGATGGLRVTFPRPLPRVKPFLGVELGLRFVLAEAESLQMPQSRVTVTTGLSAGASAGSADRAAPAGAPGAGGGRRHVARLPLQSRRRYEVRAASGRAAHAALGVLFGY
jgi:hypothetical protein